MCWSAQKAAEEIKQEGWMCSCRPTCELNACPKISPNFLAYISDFPVSVAYSTVALIRRDNARPKSFDVNFTALKVKNTNQPQERLITIRTSWLGHSLTPQRCRRLQHGTRTFISAVTPFRFTSRSIGILNVLHVSSCLYRASTVLRHYFITPNWCTQL